MDARLEAIFAKSSAGGDSQGTTLEDVIFLGYTVEDDGVGFKAAGGIHTQPNAGVTISMLALGRR